VRNSWGDILEKLGLSRSASRPFCLLSGSLVEARLLHGQSSSYDWRTRSISEMFGGCFGFGAGNADDFAIRGKGTTNRARAGDRTYSL